jgi:uncharacterized repeat protein (TIGR03806 family)
MAGGLTLNSCNKDDLKDPAHPSVTFKQTLSEYHIFKGTANDLIPEDGFYEYTLATTLFSDYAEKQRLIKLPNGIRLTKIDDDLPDFPEGTMIVKTFYYFHDKRDVSKGKRIIETRLLVKENGLWNAATYLWNDTQTDGQLLESGINTNVNWITETGQHRVVSYHVPNKRECATCHNSGGSLTPIGPKLRNMNFDVTLSGQPVNQLQHLQDVGVLNSFNHTQVGSLPQAFNSGSGLSERARAYLEINCAHCHNAAGDAAKTDLFMQYKLPLEQTDIVKKKDKILKKFEKGEMPLIGTTIVDEQGLQLLKDYVNSLH